MALSQWVGSVGSPLEGEAEDTEVSTSPKTAAARPSSRCHRPDAVCERERQVGIALHRVPRPGVDGVCMTDDQASGLDRR